MASTTSGLSNVMSTYYDKVFLDRAQAMLSYDFGAQVKMIPLNEGKTVTWNRFTPLAVATTALTEGSTTVAETAMTTTQVTATLAPYGAWTAVSALFKLTSADVNLKEHVEVHGQNAGETIDTLIRQTLIGTSTKSEGGVTNTFSPAGASTYGGIASTDVLTGAAIRKAVKIIKNNKGMRFEDGYYRGVIDVNQAYDLMGNSEWLNSVSIYTNPSQIKQGIVGELHGVKFKETNNGLAMANVGGNSLGNTIYSTLIFAKNAYGTVSLAGQPGKRIIVKTPGPNDTGNPLDYYSTVGWTANFACAVLNSSWIVRIVSAVTT